LGRDGGVETVAGGKVDDLEDTVDGAADGGAVAAFGPGWEFDVAGGFCRAGVGAVEGYVGAGAFEAGGALGGPAAAGLAGRGDAGFPLGSVEGWCDLGGGCGCTRLRGRV
jgi:hypothetical protein